MLAAAQALDYATHSPGRGARVARRLVREVVPHWDSDRILYRDLEKVRHLLLSGTVTRKVEKEAGLLV
jgi:histidine ammonia-lyase